jgi:hypothetical protein
MPALFFTCPETQQRAPHRHSDGCEKLARVVDQEAQGQLLALRQSARTQCPRHVYGRYHARRGRGVSPGLDLVP